MQNKDSHFAPLEDLKRFLADEIGEDANFDRAFSPLTDGLGLESPPRKREVPTTIPNAAALHSPVQQPLSPRDVKKGVAAVLSDVEAPKQPEPKFEFTPAPIVERSMELQRGETVFEEKLPEPDALKVSPDERTPATPPVLPRPGTFRRAMAAILDEVFVLTLFAMTLVATSNLLSAGATGSSAKVIEHLKEPAMLRMASMEFALIWMGYLFVFVGIFGRTFGMWVWNTRISFGNVADSGERAVKRIMRMFWTFVFFAPIVTLPLLWVRVRGRNLLDLLSGTSLCKG